MSVKVKYRKKVLCVDLLDSMENIFLILATGAIDGTHIYNKAEADNYIQKV